MKILICSDTYIYQTNGVVTVLITLVNGLRKLEHEVKVLAPSDCRKSFRKGDDYFIRSLPALYYPGERLCLSRSDPLLDELENWKPDLIHFHTEGMIGRAAIRFAKKTNTPLVMTTHTDFAKYVFGRFHDSLPVRKAARAVGKLFYPLTNAIIAPSGKSREFYWLRPYNDKITVIPSGICLERIQRPVSKTEKTLLLQKYGLEDNGFTLVTVARISKEKNMMELLRYWGYNGAVQDEESFLKRYAAITAAFRAMLYFRGYCYTQLTDVFQEVNGLLDMQRNPKAGIEAIRKINLL